jgi:hypothetical protein
MCQLLAKKINNSRIRKTLKDAKKNTPLDRWTFINPAALNNEPSEIAFFKVVVYQKKCKKQEIPTAYQYNFTHIIISKKT